VERDTVLTCGTIAAAWMQVFAAAYSL